MVGTVSYTHLDVYKRQDADSASWQDSLRLVQASAGASDAQLLAGKVKFGSGGAAAGSEQGRQIEKAQIKAFLEEFQMFTGDGLPFAGGGQAFGFMGQLGLRGGDGQREPVIGQRLGGGGFIQFGLSLIHI